MKHNLLACLLLLSLLSLGGHQSLAQDGASPLQVKIQELYIGILGRAADWPGLMYWENQISSGPFTLENTRAAFTDPAQAEYTEIYGGLGFTQLVIAIYENFLERQPDGPGLEYWVDELTSGRVNADQMINAIINAVQDLNATGEQSVKDLAVLVNKVEAAKHFTEQTKVHTFDLSVREAARAAVADVTDDPSTVLASKASTDSYTGTAVTAGCVPPDIPALPDGTTATLEDMSHANTAVALFRAENIIYYVGCLGPLINDPATKIAAEAAKAVALLIEEQLIAQFDVENQKYEQANP